ncbi:MAG TPA: DUF433 domain-containing protein [Tepidisphaeraceae bacterium]|nr:DUF433 domain-containing protein [Tepidisphaeraceae bacterium]
MNFDRINSKPGILGGKPCIRGTRISVQLIVEMIAGGATREQIVEQYPSIELEDVQQAIRFAAEFVGRDSFIRAPVAR